MKHLIYTMCVLEYTAIGWLLVGKGFFLSPGLPWNIAGLVLGIVAGGAFSVLIATWLTEPEK